MRSSACGITMILPPASATFETCSQEVTVPAPIITLSPKRFASLMMLDRGSGELSGTSIMQNPVSTNAAPISSASPGLTPRRMAISGHRLSQPTNDSVFANALTAEDAEDAEERQEQRIFSCKNCSLADVPP